MTDSQKVEVHIDIQDAEALPQSVRDALTELSSALASEEIQLTDEMQAAIADSDDVAGFSYGKGIPLGQVPTFTASGPTMGFCIFKGKQSEGNPCGVYSPSEGGETTSDSCTVYWLPR